MDPPPVHVATPSAEATAASEEEVELEDDMVELPDEEEAMGEVEVRDEADEVTAAVASATSFLHAEQGDEDEEEAEFE